MEQKSRARGHIDAMLKEHRAKGYRDIYWGAALYMAVGLLYLLRPKETDPEGIGGWVYVGMGVFMLAVHLRGEWKSRRSAARRSATSGSDRLA